MKGAMSYPSKNYRIRHIPTGKYVWRCKSTLASCLVPDETHPNLKPSEWEDRADALNAMVRTCFGIRNLELIEPV